MAVRRSRVSRETRLLLTAAVCAIVTLWILARIRFPDRPPASNPVTPLISQLALTPKFDDLAGEVSALQSRLESLLVVLTPRASGSVERDGRVTMLKIRPDLAIAITSGTVLEGEFAGYTLLTRDAASGLTLVALPNDLAAAAPVPWLPRRLHEPRYLVTTDVSVDRATLRPVFVGSLESVDSPEWPQPIWAVPARTALTSGAFVFTSNGELAGVAVGHDRSLAIVPTASLMGEVERLLAVRSQPAGDVGIRVQALTAGLVAAVGVSEGVVVTWVDADGPAAGKLRIADVIETVDGVRMTTIRHWDARTARLMAGESITVRVHRRGEIFEQQLVAVPKTEPRNLSLGLTVRRIPDLGVEVISVERLSVADRGGLQPGDVITLVGETPAPTVVQLRTVFASMPQGQSVVVAFTRDDAHRVTALAK